MMKKFVLVVIALVMMQVALAQSFQVVERTCEGNYLVAKVREIDGSIGYRILDYCPYGCKYGVCLSKKEVPVVNIKEIYNVKSCNDNVIFVSVTNIGGTKGDIVLSVAGEAAKWIRYPEKVSIDVNETKTIAIVASIPCNVTSGVYPFTLIGSGVINFYAPSALNIGSSKIASLPITTTVSPIDVKVGLLLVVVIVVIFLAYKYSFRKMEEEKF
jgi:microcompartment protein CcmK/EutM